MKLRRILTDKEQQFLIKNNAYEVFMKERQLHRLLYEVTYPDTFIDRYIWWSKTTQGSDYWCALHQQWIKEYEADQDTHR